MKKKRIAVSCCVLLAALLIPLPFGSINDGGTREYCALTYKVVRWHRLTEDGGIYEKTAVYWFPRNFQSIDALWEAERTA